MDDLQRLNIENECRRLMTLYCWHLDHLDPAAFANLYAEDAVYKPAIEPEPIVGRTAIRTWIDAYPKGRLGRHITTNQYVEVLSDEEAVGTSYAVVLREEHPSDTEISRQSTPRSMVEYVDKFCRTPEGWKFAERVYRMLFLQDGAPMRPAPWADFPTSIGSLQV